MQASSLRSETLTVGGMVCDACMGHVRSALLGLAGVRSADVSLAGKNAIVKYDPARVNTAQMVAAIEEEGYKASPA